MDDFIFKTETTEHYYSKVLKCFVIASGNVYLTSPSKPFKKVDGCYESYAKQTSYRSANCRCGTPTCPSLSMNGGFPVGFEIATFVDHQNRFWNMPSRVLLLTMEDREQAFKFFAEILPIPIPEAISAASRTAFYIVMSIQLKCVVQSSTRSLMHLDLIIYTLFYILDNNLFYSEIMQGYCLAGDPWNVLGEYDEVWTRCRETWIGRFLAYDALNAETDSIKEQFVNLRPALFGCVSIPFVTHNVYVTAEKQTLCWREEIMGKIIMYGENFWVIEPLTEFLKSKAIMPAESGHLVVLTEEEASKDKKWSAHADELRNGRWRYTPEHKKWIQVLDRIAKNFR